MPRRTLAREAKTMADNVKCMWKPAQSGKTRTIQQHIRDDDGVRNHLNILICSNNRLLVAQTNARMTDDLFDSGSDSSSMEEDGPADDRIVGGVYSWMSGTKKTNIPVDALAWKVFKGQVSMIVCCAHKARFRMLKELLTELREASFSKPVNVWIDEADVSVKHWSGEYDFSGMVREVTLVSATFDSVFNVYDRIRVMPFPETHPACYRGLRDCDLKAFDAPVMGAVGYMEAVLAEHPEMIAPGAKLFVPGEIKRDTHNAIAESLLKRNCIVLVLNGEKKAFLFPDGRRFDIDLTVDEENPAELSTILAEMYALHEMDTYPVAVTGQLCLGRGITFQSRDFTFDYAIIPGMKDAAAAYQCVARVLGNVPGFPPTVYMGTALLAAVERQERIAMNLARLVHENEWTDVGAEEVGIAAGDEVPPLDVDWSKEADGSPKTFATMVEAKAWGEEHLTEKPQGMYPCNAEKGKTGVLDHYILRTVVPILPVRDLLANSGHLTYGQGKTAESKTGGPKCHPVLVDGETRFLVVFKTFFAK